MRTRLFACAVAVAICVLGASLAAALSPPPSLPGSAASPGAGGEGAMRTSSHDNDTRNDSRNDSNPPPGDNETRLPNGTRNETLPAPSISPEHQSLVGDYGDAVAFEVVVTNPATQPQVVGVSMSLPHAWRGRVDAYNSTLGPGDSVTVTGYVQALAPVPARATVTLTATGRDGSDFASLDVCFRTPLLQSCPTPPPGNDTGNETRPPPRNETQPPKNDTRDNETQPPGNETQEPPQNQTSQASSASAVLVPGSALGAPAERARVEAEASVPAAEARVRVRDPARLAAPGEGTLRLV